MDLPQTLDEAKTIAEKWTPSPHPAIPDSAQIPHPDGGYVRLVYDSDGNLGSAWWVKASTDIIEIPI